MWFVDGVKKHLKYLTQKKINSNLEDKRYKYAAEWLKIYKKSLFDKIFV